MGIVHAAIYDAAVAIEGGYEPYAIALTAPPDTSPAAAVATAAHHVLVGLQPALGLTAAQQAILDGDYTNYMAAIPNDGAAKTNGIAVGEQVAAALLALRANDGRDANPVFGQPPFVPPPSGPGVWEADLSRPVLGLRLPGIRPLALESASQFRPDGPNRLVSAEYAEDFQQVKELGRFDSTARTAEQTTQALFWTDHDIRQWNDGLLRLAADRGLDLVQTARMLAMAHVSGGKWSITASPSIGAGWTMLLSNGKVLAVSGNSSELYDPDTGTWSGAGNLNVIRWARPATLLQNGKVLVTGTDESGSIPNAELYDPQTGAWSITGSPQQIGGTDTLMADCRVLVAGGFDYSQNVSVPSAELYDPATPFRGMLKSTDGGNSWFAINNGLSDLVGSVSGIPAVAIDSDDPNIIYAGTSGRGVFRSADGGASWSEFNLGLTNLSINALAIDPLGKHLYAATGAGVCDYQYATPCADPLSPANQSFDASSGTGFVNVTAASECSWTAASYANWISVTSDRSGSGSGMVSYSVAPNESTSPRIGFIGIAARVLTVTQAGAAVRIYNATVSGKKLFVTGENFDPGSVILLSGEEQKTGNDEQNPKTTVIGKKAGKKIKPGDKLQVRNPNGTLSQEFIFTGS